MHALFQTISLLLGIMFPHLTDDWQAWLRVTSDLFHVIFFYLPKKREALVLSHKNSLSHTDTLSHAYIYTVDYVPCIFRQILKHMHNSTTQHNDSKMSQLLKYRVLLKRLSECITDVGIRWCSRTAGKNWYSESRLRYHCSEVTSTVSVLESVMNRCSTGWVRIGGRRRRECVIVYVWKKTNGREKVNTKCVYVTDKDVQPCYRRRSYTKDILLVPCLLHLMPLHRMTKRDGFF